MDRVAVEAYLEAEYPELIAEAAITSLDVILDAVEAALDARPDVSVQWANSLADYFLLKRVRAVFAVNFDVSGEDGSYSLNQQYRNVQTMLDKATAKVSWIVEPDGPGASDIGKLVTITAPYLTPSNAATTIGSDEW